jgi:DNA-binding beta-propeller fold protein YncE
VTQQPIKPNDRRPFVKQLIKWLVALQVIFVGGLFAFTPGYIVPFLHNSIGLYIWIACAIWEIIGFALLYKFCPRREVLAVTAATLVVLFNAGPLTLWPLIGPALATLVTIEGPYMGPADVSSVAFSSDRKILASDSSDNSIKLLDVGSGKELRTLNGHPGFVESVAFSPDGKTLASGSADHTIKLWDVSSGKELHTLAAWFLWIGGHSDMVKSVSFSPDGKTLASGSLDKTVKLWDVASGKELRTLSGNTEPVFSVAFSSDGRTLYSASQDNTIKLWDVASGNELRTLSINAR